jgi:cyclase
MVLMNKSPLSFGEGSGVRPKILPRIIPVLLLRSRGSLVKTVQFKNPVYVGDPLNAVKIFNEKEVDELIVLDISATRENRPPDFEYIGQIATECFMPVAYGGGISTPDECKKVIACGVEKVCLNHFALEKPALLNEAAKQLGNSSVVVTMDVRKDFLGRRKVFAHHNARPRFADPVQYARWLQDNGAGEILLQSVDRDGMMQGYDLDLIREVSSSVSIPVIACGGAGILRHFSDALQAGASALAAGSRFVFMGKHRAVLINYLSQEEISQLTSS